MHIHVRPCRYNDLIEKLDLRGRGVEPDAAKVLATAVKANIMLKSIELSNNPISDVSLYTTAKDPVDLGGLRTLAEAANVNPSMVMLTLDGGKLPVDELKGGKGEKPVKCARLGKVSRMHACLCVTYDLLPHYMHAHVHVHV